MATFNICIIEDEENFREWLEEEIDHMPGYKCIGSFEDQDTAIDRIPGLNPDLVLVDLGLGDSNLGGVTCMLHIKQILPAMQFMVITSHSDDERVFEALKAGAHSYMLKKDIPFRLDTSLSEIMEASGGPMSPQIAKKVIRYFHQPPQPKRRLLQNLTPRENEVISLVADGFLNKEIAHQLDISINTVKVITHNIYKKLEVNNRVEAVRKYLKK
ncbi:MAG: response regulator transcription factor [Bacteroidota bacterium]